MSLETSRAPKASGSQLNHTDPEPSSSQGFIIRMHRTLCRRYRSGFTIVEIVVVVLVVAILAAMAFSAYRRVRSRGKAGAMIAMLESYEKSLWMYCQNSGHYPPETAAGNDPGFLSNVHLEPNWQGPYANRTSFNFQLTPIGGQWDWNNNEGSTPSPTSPGTYLISVASGSEPIDTNAGQYVDELFDDGNLNTGKWVRSRWSSAYSYVVKAREECLPE